MATFRAALLRMLIPLPFLAAPAQASAQGRDGVTALDAVTSTATRTPQAAGDIAAPVSVITREEIDRRQPRNLNDLLRDIPGVEADGLPRNSVMQPQIRGLGDDRIVVRLDGVRQNFSSGHRGRIFVEPDLLRQVDVVRGPGSLLYGSGALGGVIAFRTIDADDLIPPGRDQAARVKWGWQSNSDTMLGSATAAARRGPFDALVNVTGASSNDYEDGAGNDIPFSAQRLQSGLAKFGVTPAPHHRVSLNVLAYREDAFLPSSANTTSTTNLVDRDLHQRQVSVDYRWNDPAQPLIDLSATAYWNRVDIDEFRRVPARPARTQTTELETRGLDLQNTSRFGLFGPDRHALTVGFDGYIDEQLGGENGRPRPQYPNAEQRIWGVFVQDEVEIGRFSVIPGLRYDRYEQEAAGQRDVSDSHLSPKIAVAYRVTDWLQPYAAYTEAFRAPSLTELFVGGIHFPGNVFVPNPDLRPETARNKEVGANLRFRDVLAPRDSLRARISAFRNDIDDFIESIVTRTTTQSRNVATARIDGIEAEIQYDSGTWFATLGASALRGDNRTDDVPLASIPAHKASVTLGRRFAGLGVIAGARVLAADTRDRPAPGEPETSGYGILDLFASWEPVEAPLRSMRFYLAVDNVFDHAYRRANWDSIPSPPYYEVGRNVRISAVLTF